MEKKIKTVTFIIHKHLDVIVDHDVRVSVTQVNNEVAILEVQAPSEYVVENEKDYWIHQCSSTRLLCAS